MSIYTFVAVSEYLPEQVSMREVPTEPKKILVQALGQVVKASSGYLLAPEMINGSMFHSVRQEDGSVRVVMVDVNLHVVQRSSFDADKITAHYITRIGSLLWDEWCTNGERQEMLTSFAGSLAEALEDSQGGFDASSLTGQAFINVYMMSTGFDPLELSSSRQFKN